MKRRHEQTFSFSRGIGPPVFYSLFPYVITDLKIISVFNINGVAAYFNEDLKLALAISVAETLECTQS